jgi:hypothetical protein
VRTITPELDAALRDGIVRPVFMFLIDHPLGALRLWTGVGTLDYDGAPWTGAGTLIGVSAVEDSTELQVTQVTFQLTLPDVDDDVLAMIAHPVSKIPVRLWEAYLDPDQNVIPNPIPRFVGLGDPPRINDDPDEATGAVGRTVSLTVYGAIKNLTTPAKSMLSHEDQVARFPDDTGLSRMGSTANNQLTWNIGAYNAFSPPA